MPTGDLRVFGGYSNVARAADVSTRRAIGGRCDCEMAMPYIEIERGINLGIIKFHQHIIAGDAELGSAKGDESSDVKAAHPDQIKSGGAGGEAQLAGFRILKGAFRHDPEAM